MIIITGVASIHEKKKKERKVGWVLSHSTAFIGDSIVAGFLARNCVIVTLEPTASKHLPNLCNNSMSGLKDRRSFI